MFLKNFKFGNKRVGKDSKIFFIAEIGINHEGNLDNCKRMILEAYKSGADAVKLQTIDPDENYAKNTKFYKIFKKAFFNEEQTIKLFKYAKNVGIEFFSTIGDISTLHWFSKLNPPGYKISSGLFNHYPLIKNICKTRKPIFLSTGLATIQEIDGVFKYLKLNKVKKIALLHCCSLYPTPDSLVNLSTIKFFIDRYPSIPIGYSDHSLNDKSIIYSIVLGARIIEKHFTLDKNKLSFDHKISIEPKELRHLVAEIKNVEKMLGVYKKNLGIKEKKNRNIMRRYIVAKTNLYKDQIIKIDDLSFKRLNKKKNIIGVENVEKILGKKLKRNLIKEDPIIFSKIYEKKD